MAGGVAPAEGTLEPAAGSDQLLQVLRYDPQSEALGRREGVDGSTVGDVHGNVSHRNPARDHERRHVAKRDALYLTAASRHRRHHATRGHVNRHRDIAVIGRANAA